MASLRFWLRTTFLGAAGLTWTALPVGAQEVQWRYDYIKARQEAKEKNRPVFVDFGTVNCTWCRKLDTTTFRDPSVVQILNEQFIPLKIDAQREAALAMALKVQSFPTLVFAAPDGKILGAQEGFVDVARLSQQLQQALAQSAQSVKPNAFIATTAGAKQGDLSPTLTRITAPSVSPTDAHSTRTLAARELLGQVVSDFRSQQYVCCLDRCNLLIARYPDLPEGEQARQFARKIKSDADVAPQVCADLTDRLAEMYLGLADSSMTLGQTQQAAAYWEKIVVLCPGSRHAQVAQAALASVQSALFGKTEPISPVTTTAPGQEP